MMYCDGPLRPCDVAALPMFKPTVGLAASPCRFQPQFTLAHSKENTSS